MPHAKPEGFILAAWLCHHLSGLSEPTYMSMKLSPINGCPPNSFQLHKQGLAPRDGGSPCVSMACASASVSLHVLELAVLDGQEKTRDTRQAWGSQDQQPLGLACSLGSEF